MPFGINKVPKENLRRQTEHFSDLSGVAVIADNHLVFGCGNTMEEVCKDYDNNLRGLLQPCS